MWASVVVVHRLGCPVACAVFLDQGLNPCSLHWCSIFSYWTTREVLEVILNPSWFLSSLGDLLNRPQCLQPFSLQWWGYLVVTIIQLRETVKLPATKVVKGAKHWVGRLELDHCPAVWQCSPLSLSHPLLCPYDMIRMDWSTSFLTPDLLRALHRKHRKRKLSGWRRMALGGTPKCFRGNSGLLGSLDREALNLKTSLKSQWDSSVNLALKMFTLQ